jgi:hypothetical protein
VGNEVVFSSAELIQIGLAGVMRRVSAINKSRTPQHGIRPEVEWQADIEGILGEYALAKYFGKFWSPVVGHLDTDEGDVHGYQVRTTPWRNGCLVINKKDPDADIFILMTGENTTGRRWMPRGWLRGADGKLQEYWEAKQKDRFAFFVPQEKLNPMETLPSYENIDG